MYIYIYIYQCEPNRWQMHRRLVTFGELSYERHIPYLFPWHTGSNER